MAPGPVRRLRARRARRSDEQLLLESVLFDEEWVGLQLGRELPRRDAVRAYLDDGGQTGLSPHPLFDFGSIRLRWHPQRLEELGDGDPLVHYLRERAFGRSTHALFDIERYLRAAPEAARHPEGPVAHYCEVGAAAGLSPAEWLPEGVDLRDWVVEAWRRLTPAEDEAGGGELVTGLVSVLVVADRADDAIGSVRRLVGVAGSNPGTEVVVLDNGTHRITGTALSALAAYEGVRVVRVAEPLARPAALAAAAAHARGELAFLLAAGMRVPEEWAAPLVELLTPDVSAVQPLHVAGDGAIRSAGWVMADGGAQPLLRGFPVEDAAGLADFRLQLPSSEALLVRMEDLRARTRPSSARVAPSVRVAQRGPGPAVQPWALEPVEGAQPDAVDAWAACGYELLGEGPDGPEVRWTGAERWAIKNAAPAGPVGEVWGDTHFARSLARELRQLGKHVVIDARPAWHRATSRHDEVALVIRGPERFRPIEGQATIAWVISHPDTITPDELRTYDAVTAASVLWAERMNAEHGLDVEVMLQATDADRFHPDTALPDTGPEILFVGNTREEYRHVVRDAVESGLPVTLVGRGWHEFLDPSRVAAYSIANAELSAAYRAAGIVLSDHFADMRRDGFIANRLFDAAASGARVITDEIAGLDGLFGTSVQVYRTREELVRLATAPDRDAVFGDEAARRAVAADVREKHSFAARARRLVEIAAERQRAR